MPFISLYLQRFSLNVNSLVSLRFSMTSQRLKPEKLEMNFSCTIMNWIWYYSRDRDRDRDLVYTRDRDIISCWWLVLCEFALFQFNFMLSSLLVLAINFDPWLQWIGILC